MNLPVEICVIVDSYLPWDIAIPHYVISSVTSSFVTSTNIRDICATHGYSPCEIISGLGIQIPNGWHFLVSYWTLAQCPYVILTARHPLPPVMAPILLPRKPLSLNDIPFAVFKKIEEIRREVLEVINSDR